MKLHPYLSLLALYLAAGIPLAAGQAHLIPNDLDLTTRDARLQVRVRTAKGKKPPGLAYVQLFLDGALAAEDNCDEDGNVAILYLQGGQYSVHVSLPGYEDGSLEVRVHPRETRRVSVRLGEKSDRIFDPTGNLYWYAGNRQVRDKVTRARRLRKNQKAEAALNRLKY